MEVEIDPGRVDLAEERDEVLQRAPQPVHRPGHDHVELSPGGIAVHGVELGALARPSGWWRRRRWRA